MRYYLWGWWATMGVCSVGCPNKHLTNELVGRWSKMHQHCYNADAVLRIRTRPYQDCKTTVVIIQLRWHHNTLKRKCCHFDEILITGCTGSCHFDNFQCSQWWKFHQNEDIFVSVIIVAFHLNWVLPMPRALQQREIYLLSHHETLHRNQMFFCPIWVPKCEKMPRDDFINAIVCWQFPRR